MPVLPIFVQRPLSGIGFARHIKKELQVLCSFSLVEIQQILALLVFERDRLSRAIEALGGSSIALHSLDDELLTRVNVRAYLKAIGPKEEALEQVVTRLSQEAGVTAISWEVVATVDAEDASITTCEAVIRAT